MSDPNHPGCISSFSVQEASQQKRFTAWRQQLFEPLVRLLSELNITPDGISLTGMLVMILLPLAFAYSPMWCVGVYIVNLICDGVDGVLARHLKVTSPRGAYLDVVADHMALLITVLTIQWFVSEVEFWATLYVTGYLVLVVHFVLMNVRGNPPTFPVIRSKYILFLLTIAFAFNFVDGRWLDIFFAAFGVYYAVMVLVYILLFRWSLPSHT